MQTEPEVPPKRRGNRYLPILSWVLVLGVVLLVARDFVLRPSSIHRQRIAAFDNALTIIPRQFAGQTSEDALYKAAMRGMVDSLGDSHSLYLDKPELQHAEAQTEGEFGGVGVVVAPHKDGVLIMDVQDGPAKKAGAKPGDVVIAVDGQPCENLNLVDISSKIRGKIGTTVELTLRRSGGETEKLSMTRAKIEMDSVRSKIIEPGIGYIQLAQFDRHSGERMKKALDDLKGQGMKGLIVDVRDNAGGLLDQAIDICDLFLDKGVIVSLKGRVKSQDKEFSARPEVEIPVDTPIVILVNNGSASASEVFSGSLQAHKRATLVGARTFGKGAVNRIFALADGSGVVLTIAHYTVDDGKIIEGKGIEPDVKVGELPPLKQDADRGEIEKWQKLFWTAHEEQLNKALELMKSKLAPQGAPSH